MSRTEESSSPYVAPPLWWVESVDAEGSASGKGVALQLAGTVPGVAPPSKLLLHPGKRTLTVRAGGSRSQGSSTGFQIIVKGAARRELSPGRLMYPVWSEQYNTTAVLVSADSPLPHAASGADCSLKPPGMPGLAGHTLQSVVGTLKPFGAEHSLLRLTRPLPLVPGTDFTLHQGRRHQKVRIRLTLPPVADAEAAASTALQLLSDGATAEQATYRLWGFVGHDEAAECSAWLGEHATDAIDIGWWWMSAGLAQRCSSRLSRAAMSHLGIGVRDAARVAAEAAVGSGPAFGEAVVGWAAAAGEVLVKRDGRYFPAGMDADQVLPPAARQLRREIEQCGRVGYDVTQSRHPNTRALIDSLERLGFAIMLDNARVLSPQALDELAKEAEVRLSGGENELHQRRLAQLWQLPRNSARAVSARLVAEGRLERASSVHVRLPSHRGRGRR